MSQFRSSQTTNAPKKFVFIRSKPVEPSSSSIGPSSSQITSSSGTSWVPSSPPFPAHAVQSSQTRPLEPQRDSSPLLLITCAEKDASIVYADVSLDNISDDTEAIVKDLAPEQLKPSVEVKKEQVKVTLAKGNAPEVKVTKRKLAEDPASGASSKKARPTAAEGQSSTSVNRGAKTTVEQREYMAKQLEGHSSLPTMVSRRRYAEFAGIPEPSVTGFFSRKLKARAKAGVGVGAGVGAGSVKKEEPWELALPERGEPTEVVKQEVSPARIALEPVEEPFIHPFLLQVPLRTPNIDQESTASNQIEIATQNLPSQSLPPQTSPPQIILPTVPPFSPVFPNLNLNSLTEELVRTNFYAMLRGPDPISAMDMSQPLVLVRKYLDSGCTLPVETAIYLLRNFYFFV